MLKLIASLCAILTFSLVSPAQAQIKPIEGGEKIESKARKAHTPDPDFKSDIKETETLDGKDMQFSVQYDGGTQLKVPSLGFSFKVPENCICAAVPAAPYAVLRPNDQRGLGTLSLQTGILRMKEVSDALAGKKDLGAIEAGLIMDPDGEPKTEGSKVTMRYTSEKYVALATGLVGPSRNCALLQFIGPKEDEAKIKGYIESLEKSLKFKKPDDDAQRKLWNEGLQGFCLHYYNYSCSKSSDPAYAWEATTNIWIHLGSDGTYKRIYKYESSRNTKSEGEGGKNIQTHTGGDDATIEGTWRLEFNLVGTLLFLAPDKGGMTSVQLQTDGKKLWANGEEITRAKSDVKK